MLSHLLALTASAQDAPHLQYDKWVALYVWSGAGGADVNGLDFQG